MNQIKKSSMSAELMDKLKKVQDRNGPSLLLYGVPLETVAEHTSRNALKFFGIEDIQE